MTVASENAAAALLMVNKYLGLIKVCFGGWGVGGGSGCIVSRGAAVLSSCRIMYSDNAAAALLMVTKTWDSPRCAGHSQASNICHALNAFVGCIQSILSHDGCRMGPSHWVTTCSNWPTWARPSHFHTLAQTFISHFHTLLLLWCS
jgi:hypothetical protein